MILVIAEKKELADAIADALPGTAEREGLFKRKGNYTITYLGGHAMELMDPEEIDEKYAKWCKEDLPIYFFPWPQKVKTDKQSLVGPIEKYLQICEYVIHAGDNDDEGQFLVDEVLDYFNYTGKVLRLDTGNTTKNGLVKAFQRLTDNEKHRSAGQAAYARAISDKSFGYSLSRHFTMVNEIRLNVGRVQTPTLGLVVERDRLIESHAKVLHYSLYASLALQSTEVQAKFYPPENAVYLNEEGRVLQPEPLDRIRSAVISKNMSCAISKKIEKEEPPLPFNLVKLQTYCDKRWGYSPAEVMQITQTLRDKYRAITYNRSDCQYLTEEHFAEAPATLAVTLSNLGRTKEDYRLDEARRSKAFNGKYVTLHFAIIPSGAPLKLEQLTEKERNVYEAIACRYLMQFAAPCEKEKTELVASCDHGLFRCSNTIITSAGYRVLEAASEDEAQDEENLTDNSALSRIDAGVYSAFCRDAQVKEQETKPPKRYTQASLNEDLTRIVKYVTDPEIKALLLKKDDGKKGENGSIGTSATRSAIISNLIKRGYLKEEGRHILSTNLGRTFYNALPDEIKKADTTALWYAHQEAITAGEEPANALTESVLETINHVLASCNDKTVDVPRKEAEIVGNCPLCGNPVEYIHNPKLQAYKCQNKACDFILWETAYGKKISKVEMTKILAGKCSRTMEFVSMKTGKPYKGRLHLSVDKRKVEIIFEK